VPRETANLLDLQALPAAGPRFPKPRALVRFRPGA
jgi:hypothetical protein